MKTVYRFDYATGLFAGALQLGPGDESPLEPGVFLLPGDCVETAPPSIADGQQARWNGEEWLLQDAPVISEPVEEPLTGKALIAKQINELEASVTQRRLREAVLGTDGGWLSNLDKQIAKLRLQLK